jgi:hypothetical protein
LINLAFRARKREGHSDKHLDQVAVHGASILTVKIGMEIGWWFYGRDVGGERRYD